MPRFVRPILVLLLCVSTATITSAQSSTYEDSYDAWDAGNYVKALQGFKTILKSPRWSENFEDIALLTGELYHVDEVTNDGRRVRFDKSGTLAAYEVRDGAKTRTQIISVTNGVRNVCSIETSNLIFSPSPEHVAYLSVEETEELKQARMDTSQSARTRGGINPLVAYLEARNSRIVVRSLKTNHETTLETGNLIIVSLSYSGDGNLIYFAAGTPTDTTGSNIYVMPETGGTPKRLTTQSGFFTNPVHVPGGNYLVYSSSFRNPVPRPPSQQQRTSDLQRAMMMGEFLGIQANFVVHNLVTDSAIKINATSMHIAANGSAIVYTFGQRSEKTQTVNYLALTGNLVPRILYKTESPIGSAQLSPDGRQVVFSMMPKDDYEIYTVSADSGTIKRITNDIQHDRFPQFINNQQILFVKGEGRHLRSYLYDVASGRTMRLFHNNTVRTIAPEYEWASNPEGTKLLIGAERDGNTISPERGIYWMDLTTNITQKELLQRIEANLQSEIDLKKRGEEMFKPIAKEVKSVVDRVSVTRIYGYEKDLFEFDSKNILQPGNKLAMDYLYNKLKSFGYEPELQWFETRGMKSANVMATLKGTVNPDVVYVVSAHFDSNTRSPGADDNTSGTVTVLETARVLKQHPMPATIIFVLYTGEESGLLGSREFVRQALAKKVNIVGALNNDMVGWADSHRLDNTIRCSNAGIRDIQHAAAFLFTNLITYDALYFKATDAAAYYEAYGDIVGGIGSYPVLASPHYHQATDILEYINHQLVTETAKTTAASIMLMASAPVRLKDLKVTNLSGTTVEVAWSASPEKGVSKYLINYGPPEAPAKFSVQTKAPKIRLKNVEKGMGIAVEAVNARGMKSWDKARTVVGNK